jgi:hypothetical protein
VINTSFDGMVKLVDGEAALPKATAGDAVHPENW